MAVEMQVRNRTLTFVIPYDETEEAEWSTTDIKVKVSVVSLLSAILPIGCLDDSECCAVKFCREGEQEHREAAARTLLALPPAEREKPQDELDFCGGYMEGCF